MMDGSPAPHPSLFCSCPCRSSQEVLSSSAIWRGWRRDRSSGEPSSHLAFCFVAFRVVNSGHHTPTATNTGSSYMFPPMMHSNCEPKQISPSLVIPVRCDHSFMKVTDPVTLLVTAMLPRSQGCYQALHLRMAENAGDCFVEYWMCYPQVQKCSF